MLQNPDEGHLHQALAREGFPKAETSVLGLEAPGDISQASQEQYGAFTRQNSTLKG